MKFLTRLLRHLPSRSRLRPAAGVAVTAAALALLGHSPVSAAVTCSYGENFDWPAFTAGAASATGTMSNLDIDREAASVTVTRTGGGNLPSAYTAGATSVQAGDNSSSYSPSITATATPPYGRALYLTGLQGQSNTPATDNEAPLTFTFNKSMRNLVMHFRNGDNKLFTFTDENDQPLEFTLYHVGAYPNDFGAIPTTGTGASANYFQQISSNSLAVGENAAGTIAFKNPVTVIKMTQTYIRNTPALTGAATLNSTSSVHNINFGQYCDQPGVIDYCNNVSFAIWETPTYSASVNPDSYVGRVLDDTGKVITVTFTGGLSQAATVLWGGFENSGNPPSGVEEGNILTPVRPPSYLIATTDTATGSNPVTLTWTFSEEVKNPALLFRGGASGVSAPRTLKFYKADGVTPLPFLLRSPSSPDRNRQVDANTLYSPTAYGSTLQFVESTTAIVLKVTQTTGTGSFTFASQNNIFVGCNGTLTGAGSTIDADTDGDGVSDLTDKCPNTPAGAVVGSDGCPLPTDLSVVKTASVTKITPGVPFTYTITVTNTGAEATNVKASDVVPAGLTINSVSASDSGTTSQNGQTVQALWSIVPNGGVRTLTINVTKP